MTYVLAAQVRNINNVVVNNPFYKGWRELRN